MGKKWTSDVNRGEKKTDGWMGGRRRREVGVRSERS